MNEQLKTMIQDQKQQSFVPEYRDKATDEEALGIVVAHYFEWDGLAILKAFFHALEDANFHHEAAEVEKMIEKVVAV